MIERLYELGLGKPELDSPSVFFMARIPGRLLRRKVYLCSRHLGGFWLLGNSFVHFDPDEDRGVVIGLEEELDPSLGVDATEYAQVGLGFYKGPRLFNSDDHLLPRGRRFIRSLSRSVGTTLLAVRTHPWVDFEITPPPVDKKRPYRPDIHWPIGTMLVVEPE